MPNISFSFDDSRRDFYTNVFPLLKKYHMPATLNVITSRVEKSVKDDDKRRYMTVDEVKEVATSGLVEIASHSANHRNDIEDVRQSLKCINVWCSGNYAGGGYASPFSELTLESAKEKGFFELLENGQLKYIRSGIRTKREGIMFAGMRYINQYLKSPFLFRLMNKKFVFTELQQPFLPSVAIHKDTTLKMLRYFFRTMRNDQSVVFCLHGVLHYQEGDFEKRFNWDYEVFEDVLKFLKEEKRVKVMTTAQLVEHALRR